MRPQALEQDLLALSAARAEAEARSLAPSSSFRRQPTPARRLRCPWSRVSGVVFPRLPGRFSCLFGPRLPAVAGVSQGFASMSGRDSFSGGREKRRRLRCWPRRRRRRRRRRHRCTGGFLE